MKQSLTNLSKMEISFLRALFDGNKPDSAIAKKIGVSKASISRIRTKLEKEKILSGFLPVLDLEKLNINLFAIVTFEWTNFKNEKLTQEMESFISKDPHTILFAEGESADGLNYAVYAGFSGLDDYQEYSKSIRKKFENHIKKINVFFIPIKKILVQDYSKLTINKLEGLTPKGGN